MGNAIVLGSLKDTELKTGKPISKLMLGVTVIVICDTSGSMEDRDSRGGKSRYEVLVEELEKIQSAYPGRVGVISFSNDAHFCPNGVPFNYQGGTQVASGLILGKDHDNGKRDFFLISDGEPHDPAEAIKVAKTYTVPINTIYVGPEGGSGRKFLRELAEASKGKYQEDFKVAQLAQKVVGLLAAGNR